jgi:hypothetical protein
MKESGADNGVHVVDSHADQGFTPTSQTSTNPPARAPKSGRKRDHQDLGLAGGRAYHIQGGF